MYSTNFRARCPIRTFSPSLVPIFSASDDSNVLRSLTTAPNSFLNTSRRTYGRLLFVGEVKENPASRFRCRLRVKSFGTLFRYFVEFPETYTVCRKFCFRYYFEYTRRRYVLSTRTITSRLYRRFVRLKNGAVLETAVVFGLLRNARFRLARVFNRFLVEPDDSRSIIRYDGRTS